MYLIGVYYVLKLNIWFQLMHCCIPTPTTDSNTSTGMICVTLNMPIECRGGVPRTVREMSGIVREFHIVWRVVTK